MSEDISAADISSHDVDRRSAVWPTILILVLASLPILVVVRTMAARLLYPFDLEWIEGHMLSMAARVAEGKALYARPQVDYIPAPYFPLYFFVTGGLVKIFGVKYWVGRLLSIACTVGIGTLIYRIVRRESGNSLVAYACVAVFVSSYGLTRTWFDLVRVDMLAVFLLVLAYDQARPDRGLLHAAIPGILLALSSLAKQNGILFYPGIALVYLLVDWRKAAVFTAAFAGLFGGFCAIYNAATDGWFWKYTFGLVQAVPMPVRLLTVHAKIFSNFPVAIFVVLAACFVLLSRRRFREFFGDKWLAFFGIAYVVSYYFRLPAGGARNALIPICVGAAIAAGTSLPHIVRSLNLKLLPTIGKAGLLWILAAALAVQVVAQAQWYKYARPTAEQTAAAHRLVDMLENLDGTYYMPSNVVPMKNSLWVHHMSWVDLAKVKWGRQELNRVRADFVKRKIPYFVTNKDRKVAAFLRQRVSDNYELKRRIPNSARVHAFSATKFTPWDILKRKDIP
ncbi:MAG: glycosyltransferase family 39 protein [Deltaproteobacteria bacterium]|nr:glycosyltransferase family 39 protein [Deltaproteobacteria bacterium]